MPAQSSKSETREFTSWNSPHLLTNQFQLLAKFILALNVNVPPEKIDDTADTLKELELKIINVFSHQMMPSWLALAKSYYPFYNKSDTDKELIETLEQKLNIKATDYESLPVLIKKVFLTKYPRVNNQYQQFIDNIATVMAKLTAVALSTPALVNDAHQHDKKKFEEAGPSMANCISPIETILRHIMSRAEIDKLCIISATSLLLQVKAIKSHFEQLTLTQKLETMQRENETLHRQLGNIDPGTHIDNLAQNNHQSEEEKNHILQAWQSKEEQVALGKVFKLQKRVNQYYNYLTDVLAQSPQDKKVDAKLAKVREMRNYLDKEKVLPSQRIEAFEQQLDQTKEQLKDHRDPMWIRFLRDCLRILVLTFSGVAIYRTLTDQPVNFFKPSHGQRFVEEANLLITAQPIPLPL